MFLTIFFWLPGIIFALYQVHQAPEKEGEEEEVGEGPPLPLGREGSSEL